MLGNNRNNHGTSDEPLSDPILVNRLKATKSFEGLDYSPVYHKIIWNKISNRTMLNVGYKLFIVLLYASSMGVATVYPKKYAHGFCFAVLCCGYTLTDFPISIRLTSLALWQSNDCPSASKATLMNMDKYFMWIHYERLHNHNKAKHNKTVCTFLGIYCSFLSMSQSMRDDVTRVKSYSIDDVHVQS